MIEKQQQQRHQEVKKKRKTKIPNKQIVDNLVADDGFTKIYDFLYEKMSLSQLTPNQWKLKNSTGEGKFLAWSV